ncbi:MAG: hypothetical protein GC192_20115 [Bacteroidetes bacterium]|nr:hypothetical protein [Bacteroidota bacterium]
MRYLFVTIGLITSFCRPEKSIAQNIDSGGQTYAVVVGISDYQDPGIPDLRFADKDALAFADFLRSPAGGSLDNTHLKLLVNEQATQAQFAGALDWLWEVAKEGDRVIIYFSGHGDVEKKSLTQPGFLLCWDAPSRVYMAGGAFPLPMLQEVISTLSVQNKANVIMVADACRSGKLSGSTVDGVHITSSNLAKQYANEIKILSCQPNEYSIEGEQWGGGRGAFSYHLLDGMYGMADENEDMAVNVLEIKNYLEDKVSVEVAPHSQIPIVLGNKNEKLFNVEPDILSHLVENKKGQLNIFAQTDTRGMEADVLANVDSNILEVYLKFKKLLSEKRFFPNETNGSGIEDCADYCYNMLMKSPQMESLYSSMRRNYAVALQDDAQQALIELLKVNSEEQRLSKKNAIAKYSTYPKHLSRAAGILGQNHYMYKALKARQLFFEALVLKLQLGRNNNMEKGGQIIEKCQQSLAFQSANPHIYYLMSSTYGENLRQRDSMEYYTRKAVTEVPNWQLPYISTAYNLFIRFNDYPAAFDLLGEGMEIDSSADLMHSYALAYTWRHILESKSEDLKLAEAYANEALQRDSNNYKIYNTLGFLYNNIGRPKEGAMYLEKAIALDSTIALLWGNLAVSYYGIDSIQLAINTLLNAVHLDSTLINFYVDLGWYYSKTNEFEPAKKYFDKAYALDATNPYYYHKIVDYYYGLKDYKEAENYLWKQIDASFEVSPAYYRLATINIVTGQTDKAFSYLEKALEAGYYDYNKLQKDPMIQPLREQSQRWDDLIKKYFPDKFKN